MPRFRFRLLLTVLLAHCSLIIVNAQAPKTYSSSDILLGLKKLNTLGSVLYIAAHPDDENTRLLAYLANGRLVETGYLSLTRGDGGQNLIGPELREQLGVIRTQELLAARRIDGARQFFTRANDFGFSKTSEETLRVWDHEQVLADVVWVIRQQRPDVLIARFPPDARAGHGHHQASAILAAEAFDAAGDAKRFPEQLKYVQPWSPKRLLWNTGSFFIKPGDDMSGYLKLDAGGYNPLLGQSYGEIAARSRSQHRSQGFGSAATRGEALEYFQLVKGAPATKDIFDGVDLTWGRVPGGAKIGALVEDVIRKYDAGNPSASVSFLRRLESVMTECYMQNRKQNQKTEAALWIDEKYREVEKLILACLGLHVEAIAAQNSVVAGDSMNISAEITNRSGSLLTLGTLDLEGSGEKKKIAKELVDGASIKQVLRLFKIAPNWRLKIAPDWRRRLLEKGGLARDTSLGKEQLLSQPYWLVKKPTTGMYRVDSQELHGIPNDNATAVVEGYLTLRLKGAHDKDLSTKSNSDKPGIDFTLSFSVPVQYKHTDPVLGELYQPLAVVPPVMVNLPAARAYVFADAQPKTVPVTVRAGRAGVRGTVALQAPAGYVAEPARAAFDLAAKDQEQTLSFSLRPGPGAAPGRAELRAEATLSDQPGQSYHRGIQTIQYPHIPTQTLFPEAVEPLVKLDVKRGQTQTVGYLMGAGDEVPEALRQLGYSVTLLDPAADLTLERLRRFDAVVLGIRAYNTVERLRTQQPELLKYVEQGGNLVVQYVVSREVLLPQIGPYPLKLSNDRVTVEDAPVTLLRPEHRLLNYPNKISAADFQGWVQEQGLYYPSEWDPKYTPVIASSDPGEAPKQSAILVADYGRGHYIYTGLSFFRELPAGVPGAYRLLANLVSYGK